MAFKRYANVGTSSIRINKRLVLDPGRETVEFVALEPATEQYLINIGALEVVEVRKKGDDVNPVLVADPSASVIDSEEIPGTVVSADVNPATTPMGLTEKEVKDLEKANKKSEAKKK